MRQDPLKALWQPATMRHRAAAVLQAAREGNSPHFRIDLQALAHWAQHHLAPLATQGHRTVSGPSWPWSEQPAQEAARSAADFAVVVSLLSAHPGVAWSFDPARQDALALPQHRQSSEDLLSLLSAASSSASSPASAAATPSAAASVAPPDVPPVAPHDHTPPSAGPSGMLQATALAFESGAFSSDPQQPWRADVRALRLLDTAAVRAMFQASADNVWVGLEGRTALLRGWSDAVTRCLPTDSTSTTPRASEPFWPWLSTDVPTTAATSLPELVMQCWAQACPDARRVLGLPAGDVWPHRWAGCDAAEPGLIDKGTSGMMPLHHQALVMAHALGEVIDRARGAQAPALILPPATDALAVYAVMDAGALQIRHASDRHRVWTPADEWVIEARALGLALWELAAAQVRQAELALPGQEVPVRDLQARYAARLTDTAQAQALALFNGQGVYF